MRSVGVEEELLLVDNSGEARALSTVVLAATERTRKGEPECFARELHDEQLEFATLPHTAMADLEAEIIGCRREADAHARMFGARVAALGTSPLPVSPTVAPSERYRWLGEEFGLTTQEQLTCGCHVHVSVESDDEGVAVLDRIGPWLAVLLALSVNSPFWQGRESGYASYRNRVWMRWPSAGPVEPFGTAAAYHERVGRMISTGVLRDEGMVYFDARLSARYPTVEIRVSDVCLRASTTVLLAALSRALVETAARENRARRPAPGADVALLRLAAWRAGRSGLDGPLLHPESLRPEPAGSVVRALFEHVRVALEESGDADLVRDRLRDLLRGTAGAHVQREILRRAGSLRDVVAECADLTVAAPE